MLCTIFWAHALTAQAYIVADLKTGEVLLEQGADEERSIASITKLFVAQSTAKLDQNELLTVTKADVKAGQMRSSPLRAGVAYTRRQLTELALVSSDNIAAETLGRTAPDTITQHATIVEPSGLDPANKSTARKLAEAARELYESEVAEVSIRPKTEVGARQSTNPLLTKSGWEFYLSKTGFIRNAGGCLVVITKINDRQVIAVILGAKGTKQRWLDLIELRQRLGDKNFYIPIKVKDVSKAKQAHRR